MTVMRLSPKYRRLLAYVIVVAAAVGTSYITTQVASEEGREAAAKEAAERANEKVYQAEIDLYENQMESCERLNKLRSATYSVLIGVDKSLPVFSRNFGIDDQIKVLLTTQSINPVDGTVVCSEIVERPVFPPRS